MGGGTEEVQDDLEPESERSPIFGTMSAGFALVTFTGILVFAVAVESVARANTCWSTRGVGVSRATSKDQFQNRLRRLRRISFKRPNITPHMRKTYM